MLPDARDLSEILRTLTPEQEKVARLYFGLGCRRPHSAAETEEFGISPVTIAGILEAAKKKLEDAGITTQGLREPAGQELIARLGKFPHHHRHRRRRGC